MEELFKTLLAERYILAAFMALVIIMLVTERGLATSGRLLEWKQRADRYEKEKEEAEEALRAYTDAVDRMADALAEQNRINQALLNERALRRQTDTHGE